LYSKIRTELQSVDIRVENLQRVLSAEIHASGNSDLEKQLDEIIADEISVQNAPVSVVEVSKANFLAIVLYKANISGKGLTSGELFDLAKAGNPDYSGSPGYTNNVIYKLKTKGFVEKREERYFLTDTGMRHFGQLLADRKL